MAPVASESMSGTTEHDIVTAASTMTDVSDTLDPNGVYIRVQQWVIVGTTSLSPCCLWSCSSSFPCYGERRRRRSSRQQSWLLQQTQSWQGWAEGWADRRRRRSGPARLLLWDLSATASDASTARSPSVALPPLDPADHLGLAFERVALAQPSKVAVQSIDGTTISFTYGALLASARALAGKLSQAGLAKSNGLVGLAIARSAEGATGIRESCSRVALMCPSTRATQSSDSPKSSKALGSSSPLRSPGSDIANWLRDEWPNVATVDVAMLRAGATLSPSDAAVRTLLKDLASTRPAYVLFTSGSTGTQRACPATTMQSSNEYLAGTLPSRTTERKQP